MELEGTVPVEQSEEHPLVGRSCWNRGRERIHNDPLITSSDLELGPVSLDIPIPSLSREIPVGLRRCWDPLWECRTWGRASEMGLNQWLKDQPKFLCQGEDPDQVLTGQREGLEGVWRVWSDAAMRKGCKKQVMERRRNSSL